MELPKTITTSRTFRARYLTAFLAVCFSLVLMEGNLPNHQPRQSLPGYVLLAALPHRRVAGERCAMTLSPSEPVCANIVQVNQAGFTLIELSIVLVIIGLLAGGVLVGRDLISSASVRAQISQIEKYNQAVNTFRTKYGGLPGDLNSSLAAQFGFASRAGTQGRGDGNGLVEGWCYNCGGGNYATFQLGETALFWEDLSSANLIDSKFTLAGDGLPSWYPNLTPTSIPSLNAWLPQAKSGNGNYVFVSPNNGQNYYYVASVSNIVNWGPISSAAGLTVSQAYNLDRKMDDGLPATGTVNAVGGASAGVATPASATTCYDNAGNATALMQYSITQNNGAGMNCALSFKFQ